MYRLTPCAVLIIAISGFLLVSVVERAAAVCDGTCIPLTQDEVAVAAYGAGFRGGALVYAIALARAESSFQLNAINHNSATSIDYGLWQINTFWHPEYLGHENDLLYDASYKAFPDKTRNFLRWTVRTISRAKGFSFPGAHNGLIRD